MFKKLFSTDPFKTFYFVFGYIVVFALWWGYLLYAKNETAYKETVEVNELRQAALHPDTPYRQSEDFQKLHNKYQRQRVMIFLEGSVFMVLMIIGLLRVRKVFMHEIELAKQQKNFLLSITHELKSPISTIKLSLQTMARRKLEAEQAHKLINHSLSDVDRLDGLVDNILFAAKMERDEPGFSSSETEISELVEQLCERFSSNKKEISIQRYIQPGVILFTDRLGFTSVVVNLLENALKYSPEKSTISVTLKSNEQTVELQVADNGIGIPDHEKQKIFEKFYRVGSEDTRKTKGTGLGLYIVKRFVEIYTGSIKVADNVTGGTVFTITLPHGENDN